MPHRLQFAGKKLLRMLLLLLGVSLAAFLLMAASPLDPLQTNVGQAALGSMSQEQIAQLEDYWGVNTPLPERYLGWLSAALRGDLGTSLLYRQPVLQIVAERLGNSLGLLLSAWVLSGALGLTLGVLAGAFRDRWPDRLIRGWCLLLSSTPAFWLALLLLMVFSVWLGWFPIGLSVPIGAAAEQVSFLERLRHAFLFHKCFIRQPLGLAFIGHAVHGAPALIHVEVARDLRPFLGGSRNASQLFSAFAFLKAHGTAVPDFLCQSGDAADIRLS